jgi:hypothetical protein
MAMQHIEPANNKDPGVMQSASRDATASKLLSDIARPPR